MTRLALPLCWLAIAAAVQTETAQAATVHDVPRATSPITVDGHLDEPAWGAAAEISLAYETRPAENVPAAVETVCLITYDDDQVFIAFRAHDPEPEKIRARLSDRDTAFSDDFVGVVLDTFNDERRAYELFANPLGVQMDLTNDEVGGNEDESWDAIWSSAGRITASGYVVEMAIPFSSIGFPRTQGPQTWGLDAIRFYPRDARYRIASNPLRRDVNCYLCQLDKVRGFEGVTPGKNLELTPTLTAGRSDERADFPGGDFVAGDEEVDLGLTVSWGVTPNLNLQGTVNPDFSQVEADVAQLDVNTQFALFFPERRPFFLEDADLFRTSINAVFTRNVADPSWGVKLTGKEGKHAFGVFAAQDELTNLIFPGSQGSDAGSFAFESTDAVLRYRRDFGKGSAVGALVTHREGGDYSNQVAGVDGLVRFSDVDSLSFQVLRSESEYPAEVAEEFSQPDEAFGDEAVRLVFVHGARLWRVWGIYEDVGELFRADMGFVPQVGTTFWRGGAQRSWWGGEDDWYNSIRVGVNHDRRDEASGRRLDELDYVYFNLEGPRELFVSLETGTRDRSFNGVDFEDQGYTSLYVEAQAAANFWAGLFAARAETVDFANTRPGDVLILEPNLRFDLGRHLRLRLSHDTRRLDVAGGRLFTAGLTQARIVYQLNLRTFVRAVFQYTRIDREPSLWTSDPEISAQDERLFTQLLFSYKLNPRTVLFLGYSDNHRGDLEIDLTRENRAVFLKLGYAWVL